jgi:hypothetical protein
LSLRRVWLIFLQENSGVLTIVLPPDRLSGRRRVPLPSHVVTGGAANWITFAGATPHQIGIAVSSGLPENQLPGSSHHHQVKATDKKMVWYVINRPTSTLDLNPNILSGKDRGPTGLYLSSFLSGSDHLYTTRVDLWAQLRSKLFRPSYLTPLVCRPL